MKLNKSFSSLAAELVVVIVGILMAISIDAWWKGIEDRRSEQVLLAALAAEFERNEDLLASQFENYHRRSAAAEELLKLGPGATRLPSDSLAALWRWVLRGGTFDPSSGVLDAAASSGDIALLRDRELRVALADWPGRVQNLQFVESRVNELLFSQMIPWLRQQTALPDDAFGGFEFPDGRHETDFTLLSSSLVVENFLREEVGWGNVLDADRAQLEETLSAIVAGIRRNLQAEN